VTASLALLIPVLMKESRSGVILTRLAKKKRAETGDQRIRARIEDERGSLPALVWVSCTRPICEFHALPSDMTYADIPIDLLFTEPVVIAFSVSRIHMVHSHTYRWFSYGLVSRGVF
jgi:hypothetical protein